MESRERKQNDAERSPCFTINCNHIKIVATERETEGREKEEKRCQEITMFVQKPHTLGIPWFAVWRALASYLHRPRHCLLPLLPQLPRLMQQPFLTLTLHSDWRWYAYCYCRPWSRWHHQNDYPCPCQWQYQWWNQWQQRLNYRAPTTLRRRAVLPSQCAVRVREARPQ